MRLSIVTLLTLSLLVHGRSQAQTAANPLTVDESTTRLSFPGDHFLLDLPVHNSSAPVTVSIKGELIEPDDAVLSQTTTRCSLNTGNTHCLIEMPTVDRWSGYQGSGLAIVRVRYTITPDNPGGDGASGTLALDHIAPDLYELHVAGPENIHPGGTYTVHIRTVHPLTGEPRGNIALTAQVHADMQNRERASVLEKTQIVTDAEGFASFTFTAPDKETLDTVNLELTGMLGGIPVGISQSFNVPQNASMQLTTDKPLYQPGQTVHMRILLLDRNGRADADQKVRFDISDPDSTLVYRTEAVTSHYGIATADWAAPERLRLGSYLVIVNAGGQSTATELRLSRYDLPTFTVTPKPDRGFYLPGTNATVEVRADYLFGKPVLHGHVRVVREDERTWNYREQKYDTKEGKAVEGDLDAQGVFVAHIDLSADEKNYAGQEPSNNFGDLHLAAYVTDATSGRTEQRRFDLRITSQALHLYLTGQQRQAQGLPEKPYLSVTSADGNPAECDLDISLLPDESEGGRETKAQWRARAVLLQHLHTNALGLARLDLPTYEAMLKMRPPLAAGAHSVYDQDGASLYITARDKDGKSGSLQERLGEPDKVLRVTPAKRIYRSGDPIDVTIESAEPQLPVNVQVLRRTRHGDLVLASRDVKLANGRASATFATDQRFTGLIFVMATTMRARIGRNYRTYGDDENEPIASTAQALLFPRDNQLHVNVHMQQDTYRPGDNGTAIVSVSGPQDPDGDLTAPAPSALGLVAVDQAVEERNRTDSDFGGGDNSFFFRRYSWFGTGYFATDAGGISLASLWRSDMTKPLAAGTELAAEILLQNMDVEPNAATSHGYGNSENVYRFWLSQRIDPIREKIREYAKTSPELPTTPSELAAALGVPLLDLRDPWDKPFHFIAVPSNNGQLFLNLRSDGPDKQPGTKDDFTLWLAYLQWFSHRSLQLQQAFDAYHARTGGYIRDLDALRDEMQREGVAFDAWRDPWGQPFTYQFRIQQSEFMVSAVSKGDPATPPEGNYGTYIVGGAGTNYFTETQARIDAALNAYVATHAYPVSQAEFDAAIAAAGITLTEMSDPWGHRLYPVFNTRSIHTDSVHTEAHAVAGGAPKTHTTITPVTETVDTIMLRSAGPDGKEGKGNDDFTLATFSRPRSIQSAQDANAKVPPNQTVRSNKTGALAGIVADSTGTAIANATVLVTNPTSKAAFEAKSGRDGRYTLDPLPAGRYKVRISAAGFMDLVYDEISVRALNSTKLDASLDVSDASVSVTVQSEASDVDARSSTMGTLIDNKLVEDLPIDGRDVVAMAGLLPGAVAVAGMGMGMGMGGGIGGVAATPRVRDYFPETLLWMPEIITNDDGSATVHFPVADSITTWKISAAASTLEGNTGAGVAQFRSFQPFFAAFDPPRILTVGDTVALPVTLRNYLDHPLSVQSRLAPAPWFRMDSTAELTTNVPAQDASSPVFRYTTLAPVADAQQQFTTRGKDAGDTIERPVTVHPDGKETAASTAGVLHSGTTSLTLTIPADTLSGGQDVTLKLYPNLAAHLRDALAEMANYPGGCAEQIISTAWPSLLLQQYAAEIPHPDKKLQKQTHQYLEEAYENLLANQLANGGFAYWPKDKYADAALTAYAVQFLVQAKKYIAVDDKVAGAAVKYLAKEQQKGGLWLRVDRDHKLLPEDRAGDAMLTASIAAMIAGSPDSEPLVKKALAATQQFAEEFDEPYTLANYALAALAVKDDVRSKPAIQRLRSLALTENGGAYWNLETNTVFFGWGRAGRVESTSQALRALLAAGGTPQDDLIARGLLFLDHEQDRHSLWYSTQATARVLDVLAAIALRDKAPNVHDDPGVFTWSIDGHAATSVPLPPNNEDAGPTFLHLATQLAAGKHHVALTLPAQSASATAQVTANFYAPWPAHAPSFSTTNNEQLRLVIGFSSTNAAAGTPVDVTAHVERIGFRGYGMLIAEIGLPPGADVDRSSLESAIAASDYQLNHYEVLPDKLVVYLWPRAGGVDLHFHFSLRYGIDALTAPSVVYDYYNPDARFDLPPTRFKSQ